MVDQSMFVVVAVADYCHSDYDVDVDNVMRNYRKIVVNIGHDDDDDDDNGDDVVGYDNLDYLYYCYLSFDDNDDV
jgi:hypothetical protein